MITSNRRATWHKARVVKKSVETDNASRIELDVPTWPGNDAGSHLDLRLTAADGYQATRSYSLASSGINNQITLAVDKVSGGEVSPFLADVLGINDEVEVLGPLGHFFVWHPDESEAFPLQLIGAGSGVVPLYSIAAARDKTGAGKPVQLLYSVRGPQYTFFREELRNLEQIPIEMIYTRESPSDAARPAGRLDRSTLAQLTLPASISPRVFVCGPTSFVENVAQWLLELGHKSENVRTERFGG